MDSEEKEIRTHVRSILSTAILEIQTPYKHDPNNASIVVPELISALLELACLIARINAGFSPFDLLKVMIIALEEIYTKKEEEKGA